MGEIVAIDRKFYKVEKGEFQQVNMETIASQVKLDNGTDMQTAITGQLERLDNLEKQGGGADITEWQTATDKRLDDLEAADNSALTDKIAELVTWKVEATEKQAEIVGKIEALEGKDQSEAVTALQTKVTTLETDMQAAQGEISDLKSAKSTNDADITALQGQTESLQTGLQEAQGKIEGFESSIETLTNNQTEASGNIETLQTGLETANTEIAKVQNDLKAAQDKLTAMEERLAALETTNPDEGAE